VNIGIVSDIHGDLEGLERALKLLREKGAETIICAGDLVDKGTAPDAVVALIKAQNIPCVQGNHDHGAIKHQAWVRQFGNLELEEWRAQLLKDETIAYLEAMPTSLNFTWTGITTLVAHGTPTSRDTYLFPLAFPKAFKKVADDAKTEIVILGHTHEPMIADVRGTCLILNPGSVYRQRYESGPCRTCGLLSLPDMTFTVYDIDTEKTVTPEFVRIRLSDR
jgi:putative phosphoesterase